MINPMLAISLSPLTLPKGEYLASAKLDGSSCTVYYKDGEGGIYSRNLEFKLNEENTTGNTFVGTINKAKLLPTLISLNKNIAVQGLILF